MGSQRNIVPVNYACELLACIINGVRFHGTPRNNKSIIDEITTLQHHLEANHSVSDLSTIYSALEHSHLLGEVLKLGKECQLIYIVLYIHKPWPRLGQAKAKP